jgi:GNAT superfamily N-acetyltransferase
MNRTKWLTCRDCGSSFLLPPIEKATKELFEEMGKFLGNALGKNLKSNDMVFFYIFRPHHIQTTIIPTTHKIVGCLGAIPISKEVVYFTALKIAKSLRGFGLASRLLENALKRSKEYGYKHAFANTIAEAPINKTAVRLGAREILRQEFISAVPEKLARKFAGSGHKYWRFDLS